MIHQFFRGLYTCSLRTFFWAFKIFIAQFSCKGSFWMELFAPFLVVMRINEKVDMTPLCYWRKIIARHSLLLLLLTSKYITDT